MYQSNLEEIIWIQMHLNITSKYPIILASIFRIIDTYKLWRWDFLNHEESNWILTDLVEPRMEQNSFVAYFLPFTILEYETLVNLWGNKLPATWTNEC